MLLTLPKDPKVFLNWTWDDYQPFADRLLSRQLDAGNVDEWVNEWSDMAAAVEETYDRHYVATTVNTADKAAEQAFNNFLENLYPRWQETEQALREKLLQSGLEPANFSVPMRNFRAEADLFRAENLPLLTELEKLCSEYDRIVGAQTVEWQGVEATLTQLEPILQQQDRELRERDPQEAVRAYRRALSLGGTVTLPELYRAAGARLAFDAETLGEAVAFMEQAIERLEAERGA